MVQTHFFKAHPKFQPDAMFYLSFSHLDVAWKNMHPLLHTPSFSLGIWTGRFEGLEGLWVLTAFLLGWFWLCFCLHGFDSILASLVLIGFRLLWFWSVFDFFWFWPGFDRSSDSLGGGPPRPTIPFSFLFPVDGSNVFTLQLRLCPTLFLARKISWSHKKHARG